MEMVYVVHANQVIANVEENFPIRTRAGCAGIAKGVVIVLVIQRMKHITLKPIKKKPFRKEKPKMNKRKFFFDTGLGKPRIILEQQEDEDARRCECESLHRAVEVLAQERNEAWAVAARTRQDFDNFILKVFEAVGIAERINETEPLLPLLAAVSYLRRVERDWRELMALVRLTPDATFQQFMDIMRDDEEPVETDDLAASIGGAMESLYGLYDQD